MKFNQLSARSAVNM